MEQSAMTTTEVADNTVRSLGPAYQIGTNEVLDASTRTASLQLADVDDALAGVYSQLFCGRGFVCPCFPALFECSGVSRSSVACR